jgi:hypothetical protein
MRGESGCRVLLYVFIGGHRDGVLWARIMGMGWVYEYWVYGYYM